MPLTTLSDLETGESRNPEPALSLTLAAAFGCPSPAAMLVPPGAGPPGSRPSVIPPEAVAAARAVVEREGGDGPGPMTLSGLIEGLLRGVWAAQDGQPAGTPQTQPGSAQAVMQEHVARAAELLRAAPATTHPILAVGVVVLNEPRTLGSPPPDSPHPD